METKNLLNSTNDYFTKLGKEIKEKIEGFDRTVQANYERKITTGDSMNISKRDVRFMIAHPHVFNPKKI